MLPRYPPSLRFRRQHRAAANAAIAIVFIVVVVAVIVAIFVTVVEIDRDLSRKRDLSPKRVGFLALARLCGESWIFLVNFVLYGLGIVCLAMRAILWQKSISK